jgi:6-pyruvoyltetrahydropterin/6-carboxytetrahydropterin synthase
MIFAITTTLVFHAGHQLRLYDGSWEELHEHDWKVKVTVSSDRLDSIGVVMDFHELERLLETVVAGWRGRRLNDMAEFSVENPSAENVALHISQTLALPASVRLAAVEVWETPENSAAVSMNKI